MDQTYPPDFLSANTCKADFAYNRIAALAFSDYKRIGAFKA